MKKLRLLMAFCALLLGWSSASAQNPGDDMTSYITNPTFTNNADGWTIDGQARYFNGKGFDGTTNFIELTNWSSSWDATISQTVTVPNGYYRVKAAGQMSGTADCWMKLVANGAESRFSRNGDTNGNILANGTETTIGSGVAGWRYTSVIAHVTNGSLEISCVGHSDVKERWANFDAVTLTFLGTEFAPNTDVTDYISNWDFWGCFNDEFNGWTIEKTGGNSWVHGNTAVEHWSNDMSRTFDFYQAINNLPEGRYQISASMWNTEGTPNGNSGVYGTSSNGTVFAGVTVDCGDTNLQTYTTDGIFVNDGTLRLGVKSNGERSTNWFGVDWIKLQYVGKVVADYAVALPAGGAMVADTWYYFDIAVAGDEYNATATTLGDIICTDDGNTLTSAATGNVTLTATDNNFAVKRYYVKSSSANNLVVAAASYSYEVGDATVNIADGSYIDALSTITFTFAGASTNDPGASFALLNGSAKAILTKGGENVAEGTLSLSGKVLTATFSDVELARSSTYDIAIAADVVGYEGEAANAAISTSFKTGVIADGVYYFKKKGEYKYLTRGGNYGTETVVDNYGISLQAMIQSDGTYYLKNVDHSLAANTNKYLNMYTDQGAYAWTIAEATGGYYLKYTDGKYMTTTYTDYTDGNENTNRYYYQYQTENEAEAIVWELLSKAEYATSLTAKKNAEITALATAAGIEGVTTLAELESVLSSDYGTTDKTSAISNPLCSSASGWTAVSYNGGSKYTAVDYHAPTIQIWNCAGGITQTVSALPAGLYKITVSATWRPGNSADATRVGNEANTTAWIYANDNITQLKGWYEGGGSINSTQALVDNAASYLNTVYVYLNGSEDLKIGVAVPSFCQQNWCPIYNWTLTRYEAKATPAEKEALADAIDAAEGKTLGFEDGEYAPYNNVDAIEALATAKAINPEEASGAAVVAATTALTGATWTANVGEKNAIYWDYSALEETNDRIEAKGWYDPAVQGQSAYYCTRIVNNKTTNTGLTAVDGGYALFTKQHSHYGDVDGYTLPLKASRTYKLTFKYAGWGNEPSTTSIYLTDDEGNNRLDISGTFVVSSDDAKNGNSHPEAWVEYTGYFAVPATGNYVLYLNRNDYTGNNQRQVVMGSIDLRTAEYLVFADNSAVPTYAPGTYPTVKITRNLTANRWATAVYPFAVSGVDNIAVLDSYDSEGGALAFTSAAASTANEPFFMMSNTNKNEITLSNVAVAAANATPATASEASLIGAYTATDITNAEKNYVLSSNKIFSVGTDGATINPYRAYIQLSEGGSARALSFVVDGKITGVDNVKASTEATLKDGKYLENGKIVIVKNGVKYNAAGSKLY